jgi:hypothetical protein
VGFLDSLSKTLSSGVDRAKFEADKFQRTSRVSGEINNIKSQIDTNVRQLGERALELYDAGAITAPEVASLAQIIAQLREQLNGKEGELQSAQNETFEVWQTQQPQQTPGGQNVPVSSEQAATPSDEPLQSGYGAGSAAGSSSQQLQPAEGAAQSDTGYEVPSASGSFTGRTYDVPESNDLSGSGMVNSSSVGGASVNPTTCPSCGYIVPANAAFCPNCGNRVQTA